MQTVAIVLAKRRRKFSGKRIPHIPYEYYIIIVLGQMEGFPGISDFLAAALVVPQQQSANEPTGGIRAASLSLGTPPPPRCWWFVVSGTLMRHQRNGCLSFRALRTERCPRFPAVFACITPRAACATCIQPYRACRILETMYVPVKRILSLSGILVNSVPK